MAIQNLRSSSAHKRPIPTVLSSGQIAINTNEASPGLFFKDSNGDLVKVGPVHIGTSAPNSSPATTAADALVSGTVYQILTVGNTDFTAVGASANTVGTVFTATGAGTGTGTVSGQQGNEKGEQWLDTTGGAYDLKIYDGSAWRSQAGEFVNHTGDTMTGVLQFVSGSASAPGIAFSGDTNTGIFRPGADSVAIATGGTQRITVDSSGRLGINSTTPEERLHVNGAIVSTASNSTSSVGGSNRAILDLTSGGARIGHFRGTTSAGSGYLGLFVDSSERLRIDSSGNVSVGSTTVSGTGVHLRPFGNVVSRRASGALQVFEGYQGSTLTSEIKADGSAHFDSHLITGSANSITSTSSHGSYIGEGIVVNAIQPNATLAAQERVWLGKLANVTKSEIFKDGSATFASNVGIGTSSPAKKLHVSDTSGPAQIRITGGTGSSDIYADANIYLQPNGTTRATFLSNGNVGIGTTSASSRLHVKGAADSYLTLQAGTTDGNDGILFKNSAGTQKGAFLYDTDDNYLLFNVNESERVRIDSSGNVGIGKSSSLGARLHVQDDSATDTTQIKLRNYKSGVNTKAGLMFECSTSGGQGGNSVIKGVCGADAGGSNSSNDGGLDFQTSSGGSGTLATRMLISSSGQVGIGTASPVQQSGVGLHINNASGQARLKLTSQSTGATANDGVDLIVETNNEVHLLNHEAAALKFGTSDQEKLRIDSSGRVGVGTTSPSESLEVAGNGLKVSGQSSSITDEGITFDWDSGNNNGRIFSESAGSSNLLFYTTSSGTRGERMRIDSAGRVMIGNTAAGNLFGDANNLVVGNGSGHEGMSIYSGTTSNSNIMFADGTGANSYAGYIQFSHNQDALKFGIQGNDAMMIDSSRRLLIGTAIAATNAEVTIRAASPQLSLYATPGNVSRFTLGDTDDSDIGQIGYDNSDNSMFFSTNNATRMSIDSSGRVGIKTSSMSSLYSGGDDLVVGDGGGSNQGITIFTGTGNQGIITFADGFTGAAQQYAGYLLYSHADDRMTFATTGQERMRIDSSGNVGIGTTNMPHKLCVNGNIQLGSASQLRSSSSSGQLQIQGGSTFPGGNILLGGGNADDNIVFNTTGASAASTERMRIDSSGRLGLGTSSPRRQFHIHNSASATVGLMLTNGNTGQSNDSQGFQLKVGSDSHAEISQMENSYIGIFTNASERTRIGPNGDHYHRGADYVSAFYSNAAAGTTYTVITGGHSASSITSATSSFAVYTNGNVLNTNNSYGSLSDAKLKENIVDASSQWDDIKDLRVRNYNFIEGQTHTQIGVVAQEVETVSPGLVTESPDTDEEGNNLGTTTKAVNYSVLYMKAVKALQEAMDRIETLEAKVAALEAG